MKRVIVFFLVMAAGAAISSQSITVTSPKGGENWTVNSPHDITWTFSGYPAGTKVKLLLIRDGTILGEIATNVDIGSNGAGSYANWPAGAYAGTPAAVDDGYKVRIRDMNNQFPSAQSAATFSITSSSLIPFRSAMRVSQIAQPVIHSSGNMTVLFNHVCDLDEGHDYYSKIAANGTDDFWWSKNSVSPHQYMLIPESDAKFMRLDVPFEQATKSYLMGRTGNMTTNPIVSQDPPINMVVGFVTDQVRVGVLQVMNVGASNDQLAIRWITYGN